VYRYRNKEENEQAKSLIVGFLEGTGHIISAFLPPVAKSLLSIPYNIVTIPFKWLFKKQDLSFSKSTLKMAQKGLIGLVGPMIFAWWMTGIIVRSIDQLEKPSSKGNDVEEVGSSTAKHHGKKAPDLNKIRVHRRLLVGFGNCAFDLPYNDQLELGISLLLAWMIFNVTNYTLVVLSVKTSKIK
jgi:hypothetical protein